MVVVGRGVTLEHTRQRTLSNVCHLSRGAPNEDCYGCGLEKDLAGSSLGRPDWALGLGWLGHLDSMIKMLKGRKCRSLRGYENVWNVIRCSHFHQKSGKYSYRYDQF